MVERFRELEIGTKVKLEGRDICGDPFFLDATYLGGIQLDGYITAIGAWIKYRPRMPYEQCYSAYFQIKDTSDKYVKLLLGYDFINFRKF